MVHAGLDVPVVFLVFNRPEHTARVFSRIRDARPSKLFVVADGPRTNRAEDSERCAQVRAIIEEGIDWPCEVIRDYSESNHGCARRVSSGITSALQRVEEAIILEDDCLPDPTFFQFCDELLERFRKDTRVAQIAGVNFQKEKAGDQSSYYFSQYAHCWGWATWRRAWEKFQFDLRPASQVAAFDEMGANERRYWAWALQETAAGRIDSWAYRWQAALFRTGSLSVTPNVNMVRNIGFGADATHTDGSQGILAMSAQAIPFPLRHPERVERDRVVDAEVGQRLFTREVFAKRLIAGARRRLFR
jgi:hypothetical protein